MSILTSILGQIVGRAFGKKATPDLSGFLGPSFRSIFNKYTGAGMTDAEIQANDLSMQNMEDSWQRNVSGMQKAGLNPALMYGSSPSGNAPTASTDTGALSMSDLMSALLLPMQRKMLGAQVENINADTEKKRAETGESGARTEQIKQLVEWYPRLSEQNLRDISTHADLNVANKSLTEVQQDIAEAEKVIRQAEADESSEYFKARREAEQAKDDEALAAAAAHLASAAWQDYETSYTKSHGGARPASSSILALANAIASSLKDVGKSFTDALSGAFPGLFSSSDNGPSENPFPKGSPQWLGYEAARKHSSKGGSR